MLKLDETQKLFLRFSTVTACNDKLHHTFGLWNLNWSWSIWTGRLRYALSLKQTICLLGTNGKLWFARNWTVGVYLSMRPAEAMHWVRWRSVNWRGAEKKRETMRSPPPVTHRNVLFLCHCHKQEIAWARLEGYIEGSCEPDLIACLPKEQQKWGWALFYYLLPQHSQLL